MNKELLKSIMVLNGDTQKGLSEYLGITEQTLSNKIHEKNGNGFSQSEILKIIDKYRLNAYQTYNIFFNTEVSKKDT